MVFVAVGEEEFGSQSDCKLGIQYMMAKNILECIEHRMFCYDIISTINGSYFFAFCNKKGIKAVT